mmetsp:Transcript_72632/g.163114  ORF Transcript_72632/g.163114 Transcript_72632/m.163114 type:complete len:98 (-) Transcript_72632:482-775(-)
MTAAGDLSQQLVAERLHHLLAVLVQAAEDVGEKATDEGRLLRALAAQAAVPALQAVTPHKEVLRQCPGKEASAAATGSAQVAEALTFAQCRRPISAI